MYKSIVLIIILLCLFLWVYYTIKINNMMRSSSQIETFLDKNNISTLNNNFKKLKKDIDDDNVNKPKNIIEGLQGLFNNSNLENMFNNPKIKQLLNNPNLQKTILDKMGDNKCSKSMVDKPNKPPKCKFMPSFSKVYNCPEKYPNHLGGVLGTNINNGMICNGQRINAQQAKAYCIIRDGKLDKIQLTKKGTHYKKNPKVKIIGSGSNAKARAILDKMGSIKTIKLLNKGQDYHESPKVIIEPPNGEAFCHMCCKFP